MSGKGGGKKKDDGVFDIEEQFILRVPPNVASELRQDLQSGAQNLKDKLMIDLNSEQRKGKVIYNGQIFNAKLFDLPCIIESLKTTDQKTFYKTANISQMLVCGSDDDDDDDNNVREDNKKKKDKDKKYQWPHGICRPLKNVRNRRFRKPMPRKNAEQPDIDKEVRKLFEQDSQAARVSYEIAYEETNQMINKDAMLEDSTLPEEEGMVGGDSKSLQIGEIFGDVSSSDDDDQEVNVMDSADEGPSSSVMPADDGISLMDDFVLNEMCSSEPDNSDLHSKQQEVTQQLNDLRDKRIATENNLAIADNTASRDLLEAELQSIMEEESTKEKELVILNSTLNVT